EAEPLGDDSGPQREDRRPIDGNGFSRHLLLPLSERGSLNLLRRILHGNFRAGPTGPGHYCVPQGQCSRPRPARLKQPWHSWLSRATAVSAVLLPTFGIDSKRRRAIGSPLPQSVRHGGLLMPPSFWRLPLFALFVLVPELAAQNA